MKFRKKPVVVDAYRFKNFFELWPEWLLKAADAGVVALKKYKNGEPYFLISSIEGEMEARLGDWIIRGVAGELYPCRDDIFQMTYEAVEE